MNKMDNSRASDVTAVLSSSLSDSTIHPLGIAGALMSLGLDFSITTYEKLHWKLVDISSQLKQGKQ